MRMSSIRSASFVRQTILGGLFWFVLTACAFAQQQNDDLSPGVISGTSTFATPYANGEGGEYFPRLSVQHRTEGAGYDYSFTDFRTWVPLYESYDARSLTFFDGALLLANDQNVGMNAVIGQRFYFDEIDRTFGAYAGYDNRDTGHQMVGQVVTGIESLGRIDFRANGYFPTDTDPLSTGGSNGYIDPTFVGYNIQLTQLTRYEVAMKGFDAEFGGALPHVGDYVRAYLGMYNFQGEGSPQAWGWKTRFESHVTDRMRFYLTVSDDQVFNTNVVFGAAFFFPGSSARREPRYDSFVNKMDEPLIRNEAVVVNNVSNSSVANATNTVTGDDQHVIHVDPNATAPGDGTVENPYNTLAAAQVGSQPNDIILVHPRADNTATNLTQNMVLQDNQRLLASTTQHQFTATQGTFDLPGYEAGDKPKLDSTGVAIALADNNEVSGFHFDDPVGTAIQGAGVNGFNINNNYFNDIVASNVASIDVTGFTGTGEIRDNTFYSVGSSGAKAINFATSGIANLTIDGNTIQRTLSGGATSSAIYLISSSTADLTVNVTNNYIYNLIGSGDSGILLQSSGDLVANITNNEIYNGATVAAMDYGIRVLLLGDSSQLTIDRNTIGSIATAQAVDAGILVYSNTTGDVNAYITNNTVSDFLTGSLFSYGIRYEAFAGGTDNVVMTGNDVNHSLALGLNYGYSVEAYTGSTINLNFQDNVASGTFGNNSAFFFVSGSTLNIRMLDNTIDDNVRFHADLATGRIYYEVFGGQTVPSTLVSSDVTGQNTIGGSVNFVNNFGGSSTRVAPNSLPIPE